MQPDHDSEPSGLSSSVKIAPAPYHRHCTLLQGRQAKMHYASPSSYECLHEVIARERNGNMFGVDIVLRCLMAQKSVVECAKGTAAGHTACKLTHLAQW